MNKIVCSFILIAACFGMLYNHYFSEIGGDEYEELYKFYQSNQEIFMMYNDFYMDNHEYTINRSEFIQLKERAKQMGLI